MSDEREDEQDAASDEALDRERRTGVLAGQIKSLGGAFGARLVRDRALLAELIGALQRPEADTVAALRRVELAAHRLHGTAAMFGHAKLGRDAGRVEAAAHAALTTGLSAATAATALQAPHRALDAALARAIAELGADQGT